MKAKYIFGIVALALGMTACENYFDEKYLANGEPQKTDVKTYVYTLVSADYSTVAKNKNNQALAARMDTIEGDSTYQKALEMVGKNKYFDTLYAQPKMYLPAFIYAKYPQLSAGSIYKVTYNMWEGLPEYLAPLSAAKRYTLSNANYETAWGVADKKYLTPDKEAQVASFLPATAEEDQAIVAKYNYCEIDGGAVSVKEVLYVFKSAVWTVYSAKPAVEIMPEELYGQMDKWVANNHPYAKKKDQIVAMCYSSKKSVYDAVEYNYNGEAWIENTGIIEETKSYGLTELWEELPVYYKQAIAEDEDQGEIKTYHYDLQEGITYIWAFNKTYGMKGSAYYGGPHTGEGWFVTPQFSLKKANTPALTFDHAINYGPADTTRYRQLTVWVSKDFNPADENADLKAAEWKQIPWPEYEGENGPVYFKGEEGASDTGYGFPALNSWIFYNVGNLDLSEYKDETIVIGFKYQTKEGETCPTWEVKNIIVQEP